MNMKRILSLALMALLLCMLPVWAMAAEMKIEGRVLINPKTLLDVMGDAGLLELVVTKANSTIVFDGVEISDGEILIHCPENANVESVKIELIGDNSISTDDEYGIALRSGLPLTIAGEGSLTCTSDSIAISCYYSLTMQSGKLTAKGAEGGIFVEGLNFSFQRWKRHWYDKRFPLFPLAFVKERGVFCMDPYVKNAAAVLVLPRQSFLG